MGKNDIWEIMENGSSNTPLGSYSCLHYQLMIPWNLKLDIFTTRKVYVNSFMETVFKMWIFPRRKNILNVIGHNKERADVANKNCCICLWSIVL